MEEDKIDTFFKGMRKADEYLVIPPFPKRKTPRRLKPLYPFAAAVFIAAFVVVAYLVRQAEHERMKPGEVPILVDKDAFKTHSLVDVREESLSEWESPTEYLSTDFN
jgi:hypothetical protein